MTDQLPPWFVLQPVPSLDVEIKELKRLGLERISLLKEINKEPDAIKANYYSRQETKNTEHMLNYLKGHIFLRLVGAHSPKVGQWLIEMEGDLFDMLFSDSANISSEDILPILYFLYGKENVLLSNVFTYRFRDFRTEDPGLADRLINKGNEYFIFNFTHFPSLVGSHKGRLYQGWLIVSKKFCYPVIKKHFERRLSAEIEKLKEKLGINEEMDRAVFELEEKLPDIQLRRDSGKMDVEFNIDFDVHGDELVANDLIRIFPPCMRFLIYRMEKTGYMAHNLRLQLGIFLKKIGMSLDEQMQFWYQKSVDNVNIPLEVFTKHTGYLLRHLYGLEGSRKDYEVSKCETNVTNYFCFFCHLPLPSQTSFLKSFYPDITNLNAVLDKLEYFQSKGKYGLACGYILTKSFFKGSEKYWEIKHPLQWTKSVSKRIKGKQEDQEGQKEQEEGLKEDMLGEKPAASEEDVDEKGEEDKIEEENHE